MVVEVVVEAMADMVAEAVVSAVVSAVGSAAGATILAPSAATATIPARPAGPSVHFAGRDTMQGPCASRGSGSSSSARNDSNRLAMRVVIKAP
jgi:uncharacterized protein (DUF697 family)